MAVAVQKDQIKIEERQKKDRETKEQQRKQKKQLTRLRDWCKFKLNSMWAKRGSLKDTVIRNRQNLTGH